MPTIFIVFGFCFKFYSNDHEPVHIHVTKDGHERWNEYFKKDHDASFD
ncbi:MAG: DUF4160 domain-containing protein [Bacteroidales bacterium]|nr:DUF4160 domain-containing protein [Bacteroidales bacterium]MBR1794583.1 DUF4160 domain-containing protein [Bacteroidales bacterium]